MINSKTISFWLSLYHINLYFLQLWPTFWVSRCRGFLLGSNSLNRLQLSCSLSHLQAGSTVMLSNYCWDTVLVGKNTCSLSRRNRETDSASSDSVSTNQSIENTFTACVRLVMLDDCWWCRERGDDITARGGHLCALGQQAHSMTDLNMPRNCMHWH